MVQIRRKIGTFLRKIREGKKMPLDQAIAELSLLKIKYSKSALSRLERDLIPVRADIVAGLGLIYGVKADSIVYKNP
jgi:transcriptional regulator with XRE-family HTH domain